MRLDTFTRSWRRGLWATAALVVALSAAGAEGHPGHGPQVVNIGEFKYDMTSIAVVEGDYLFFAWNGPDTNHSVTSDDGQGMTFDSDAGKAPNQVEHKAGDGYSVRFRQPGTFAFHCKVHPFMKATVTVTALSPSSKPGAARAPKLSHVKVSTVKRCRRSHCNHAGVIVRFTLNHAVSMRATVRRHVGTSAVGKVLRERDFAGPPGMNRRKLNLGHLARGRYQLKLVAVDSSSGKSTKPILRTFAVA